MKKNWGGRIIILTVSIIPTQDEPDFCKSSASTVSTGSEPGPVLGVLGGAEPLKGSGLRPSAEWVQDSAPSDGARTFQSIGLIWKLCLQKRKTSHQQSAALACMSLSLQLLIIRGTFTCRREPSSNLARLSPSDTLLDVDGCVCSFYLLSPEPSFSSFLSALFQGCISPSNLSFPYPTRVQPALLLPGHTHTPVSCPKLNCTHWTISQNYMHRPWARGLLCLLFPPLLVWEKIKIWAEKAAMTFENPFSFHHSTNA